MRPASEPGSARARPGRVSRARRWSAWIDGSRTAYERMGMPPAFQWARLKADVKCARSEEHTSELQSRLHLVCRLLLEKKKNIQRRCYSVQDAERVRVSSRAT